ncbi:MAG: hypothetical protein ABSF46_33360 [Terriglobia bacterium]|jgi:hypothetical protein
MRRIVVLLVIALLLAPVLTAQDAQQQSGEQEQKPTLGPKPGPGESGPRTATVNDYRKLVRIRTLYVERMDNELSERLVASLGKLGRFKIATNAKEADAVVRGSCLESRRLKRLHTEVSITDRGGGSIWQDVIFRPYNPPALAQAVNETAQMIAEHLGESINQAGLK